MDLFKIKDLLVQYISYGYVILVSLILSIIIARMLGPVEFGIYATALSVGSILGILFDFGFKHIIQRETANPSERFKLFKPQLLSTALGFLFITLSLSMIFLCLIFPNWKITILCIGFCFANITISQFISAYFKGQRQFIKESVHLAGARSVSAIAIFAILFAGVASYNIILLAWGMGVLLWNVSYNKFAFSKIDIAPIISFVPVLSSLFIIDISITIYFRADIILLQYLGADKEDIGYFSAALRLVEAFILLGIPLRSMFQTYLRQEKPKKIVDIKLFIQRLLFLILVGTTISLSLNWIAEPLIRIVYGEQFYGASAYLKLLSWILIPAYILAFLTEMMIVREAEIVYKYLAASIATLTILLIIFVQGWLGVYGIVQLKVIMEAFFGFASFILIFLFISRRSAD